LGTIEDISPSHCSFIEMSGATVLIVKGALDVRR
jgi:hypothetical protein